jgi:hypothetical protein
MRFLSLSTRLAWLPALGLTSCATGPTKMPDPGPMIDHIPHWLGGEPEGIPPRPGTPEYEAWQTKREGRGNDQTGQPVRTVRGQIAILGHARLSLTARECTKEKKAQAANMAGEGSRKLKSGDRVYSQDDVKIRALSEGRPGAASRFVGNGGVSTSVSHNDMAQVSRAPS